MQCLTAALACTPTTCVAKLLACFPGIHEALGLILLTEQTRQLCIPVIPVLSGARQEDQTFKVIFNYTHSMCEATVGCMRP